MKHVTLLVLVLVPLALIAIPDKPGAVTAVQNPVILPGCQEWRDVDYLALYPQLSRLNRTDRPRIVVGSWEQLEGYTYQLLPNYCPNGAKPWIGLVRAFEFKTDLADAFSDYDPDPTLTSLTLAEWSAYLSGGPKPSHGIIFLRVRDFRVFYPPGPSDYLVWGKVLDTNLPLGTTDNLQRWDGWYEDLEHGSGQVTHPLTGMDMACAGGYLTTLLDAAANDRVDVLGLLGDAFSNASWHWETWDTNNDGVLLCTDVPGWTGDPSNHWLCATTPSIGPWCEKDIPAWTYIDSALGAIANNTW